MCLLFISAFLSDALIQSSLNGPIYSIWIANFKMATGLDKQNF